MRSSISYQRSAVSGQPKDMPSLSAETSLGAAGTSARATSWATAFCFRPGFS